MSRKIIGVTVGTPISMSKIEDEINTANFVSITPQTLTDAQKEQARANIGAAAPIDTSSYLTKSGGTLTGKLIAQNNTNYTTKQVRNVFLVAEGSTLPTGANGDICLVYTG